MYFKKNSVFSLLSSLFKPEVWMALTPKLMVYAVVIILDCKLFVFFGSYLSVKYCTNSVIHNLQNLTFSFPLGEEEYLKMQSVCGDVFGHPELVHSEARSNRPNTQPSSPMILAGYGCCLGSHPVQSRLFGPERKKIKNNKKTPTKYKMLPTMQRVS